MHDTFLEYLPIYFEPKCSSTKTIAIRPYPLRYLCKTISRRWATASRGSDLALVLEYFFFKWFKLGTYLQLYTLFWQNNHWDFSRIQLSSFLSSRPQFNACLYLICPSNQWHRFVKKKNNYTNVYYCHYYNL